MSKHVKNLRAFRHVTGETAATDAIAAAASALELAEKQLSRLKRVVSHGAANNGVSSRECHNAMVVCRALAKKAKGKRG